MSDDMSLGEAARSLGVSADTLRRWDREGKLHVRRDARNHRRVPLAEVERLRGARRATRPATSSPRATASGASSARSRSAT
jgi:excisionase family DNA binding protein